MDKEPTKSLSGYIAKVQDGIAKGSYGEYSSVGRTLDCGSGGHGFESHYSPLRSPEPLPKRRP